MKTSEKLYIIDSFENNKKEKKKAFSTKVSEKQRGFIQKLYSHIFSKEHSSVEVFEYIHSKNNFLLSKKKNVTDFDFRKKYHIKDYPLNKNFFSEYVDLLMSIE